MNAAEQATNVELASKIATVVNCFKQEFPDVHADLRPWANDPDTLATVDPESIDIGFHLPGWSPRYQCRSMLVQLRCHGEKSDRQLLGLDVVGEALHGVVQEGLEAPLEAIGLAAYYLTGRIGVLYPGP